MKFVCALLYAYGMVLTDIHLTFEQNMSYITFLACMIVMPFVSKTYVLCRKFIMLSPVFSMEMPIKKERRSSVYVLLTLTKHAFMFNTSILRGSPGHGHNNDVHHIYKIT